jgi:hypothetical protein
MSASTQPVLGAQGSTRKRGRVGHEDGVGPTGQLGHADPATRGEHGREQVVCRVHVQRRALEILPVAQRDQKVVGGERLAADHTVLVAPGHPDRAQPLLLDLGDDPLRGFFLLVAPEPVSLDEADLADAEVFQPWHRSTSGSLPDQPPGPYGRLDRQSTAPPVLRHPAP